MDYVIQHHGILGQRWGIRRFQNPDGSLTEAGKKRYYSVKNAYKKRNAIDYELANTDKKNKKLIKRYAEAERQMWEEAQPDVKKAIDAANKLEQIENSKEWQDYMNTIDDLQWKYKQADREYEDALRKSGKNFAKLWREKYVSEVQSQLKEEYEKSERKELKQEILNKLNLADSIESHNPYSNDPKKYEKFAERVNNETQRCISTVYNSTKDQSLRRELLEDISSTIDCYIYDSPSMMCVDKKTGKLLGFDENYMTNKNIKPGYSESKGYSETLYSPKELDKLYGYESGTVDYYEWGHYQDQDKYDKLTK